MHSTTNINLEAETAACKEKTTSQEDQYLGIEDLL
jgi:hypothetical protein